MSPLRHIALGLFALATSVALCAQGAKLYGYKVEAKLPHSTANYTEGLFYQNGLFYEGTGMENHSSLLVEDAKTGKVMQRVDMPAPYFGEGVIDWEANLYQWTWQTHTCFVYDRFTLRLVKKFTYSGEGWGMTRTAKEIITSDGTATLRFRNPETFQETHHIVVKDGSREIDQLNELEFVKGEIYANVWHDNRIARISPRDGRVLGWIDLNGILPQYQSGNSGEAVLNGIAYDAATDRLFVTGKNWPTIFQITVVPKTK